MAKKNTIPTLGAEFGGGFFGGEIIIGGERFALVVASKVEGEKLDLEYKEKKLNAFDGTVSDDEGLVNSDLINDANHPAAQFCRSLRIAGHDDWYLPSRDELATIWRSLGPNRKKTPELFKAGAAEAFEGSWYWSSTEYAQYSYDAWLVDFGNGYQYNNFKGYDYGVRAVRRIKL